MGRKIPGRKHKGVNDPLKQQAARFNKIKDKINAPPTDVDEQHVPKRLKEIMDLKKKVKEGKIPIKIKARKKKSGDKLVKIEQPAHQRKTDSKGVPEKPVPAFKQNPGESDERFMHRVSRMCHTFLKESAFENKYKVNIKRNPETGAVEDLVKRPKVLNKEKPQVKVKGKETEPKLTKSQRRQLKLKEKKRLKMENKAPEEWSQKDEVMFGEIVHQPPNLKVPMKAAKKGTERRNLLLQDVLEKKPTSVKDKVIDRTSKRKDLPKGVRLQLEKHRDEVVNAYKLLKAGREKTFT